MPDETRVVFHNRSKYHYHFIIKELANEFEGPFECSGENSEIYKRFFAPIKRELIKIDKDGNKSVETISCKIKFIDSMRFMATSLSQLVNNLIEGIHKIKCAGCGWSLEYERVKNDFIEYKCLFYNKDH